MQEVLILPGEQVIAMAQVPNFEKRGQSHYNFDPFILPNVNIKPVLDIRFISRTNFYVVLTNKLDTPVKLVCNVPIGQVIKVTEQPNIVRNQGTQNSEPQSCLQTSTSTSNATNNGQEGTLKGQQPLHVKGTVNFKEISFVCDTGSGVSLCRPELVNANSIMPVKNFQLVTAASENFQPLGEAKLEFTLGGEPFVQKVFVSSQLPEPVILGVNFLEYYNGLIDFDQQRLTLRRNVSREIHLNFTQDANKASNRQSSLLMDANFQTAVLGFYDKTASNYQSLIKVHNPESISERRKGAMPVYFTGNLNALITVETARGKVKNIDCLTSSPSPPQHLTTVLKGASAPIGDAVPEKGNQVTSNLNNDGHTLVNVATPMDAEVPAGVNVLFNKARDREKLNVIIVGDAHAMKVKTRLENLLAHQEVTMYAATHATAKTAVDYLESVPKQGGKKTIAVIVIGGVDFHKRYATQSYSEMIANLPLERIRRISEQMHVIYCPVLQQYNAAEINAKISLINARIEEELRPIPNISKIPVPQNICSDFFFEINGCFPNAHSKDTLANSIANEIHAVATRSSPDVTARASCDGNQKSEGFTKISTGMMLFKPSSPPKIRESSKFGVRNVQRDRIAKFIKKFWVNDPRCLQLFTTFHPWRTRFCKLLHSENKLKLKSPRRHRLPYAFLRRNVVRRTSQRLQCAFKHRQLTPRDLLSCLTKIKHDACITDYIKVKALTKSVSLPTGIEHTTTPSLQMSSASDEISDKKFNYLPKYENVTLIFVICCVLACAVMTVREWLSHLKNPLEQYFNAKANVVRICTFDAYERFLSPVFLPVKILKDRLKVLKKLILHRKSQHHQVLRKCKFKTVSLILKNDQPVSVATNTNSKAGLNVCILMLQH
ncbi:unnamed protein product [Bemisia tabaci]|uniref:Uncharacterized protein n=1 Tax=Bemisia tabaci TaxID=7038 RepID=A0A9P0CFQ3_BEMTA|nr:unnamed protein product [Bemisia tabaci]